MLAAREPNIRVVGKHVRDAVPQVQEGSQQQVQDAIDGLKLIALRVDELLPRSKVSCSTHTHTQTHPGPNVICKCSNLRTPSGAV